MPKFSAKVVIDYDGVIGVEPGTHVTTAKRNEMMRDVVWLQLNDALAQYGFKSEVSNVRKVQND
jgi:hypothetical protein